MAKPVKHGNGWRARWLDSKKKRRSKTFKRYDDAYFYQQQKEVEAQRIRRGLQSVAAPEKTFNELFDYWLEKRAVRKKRPKDDLGIIRKHLRPHFGHLLLADFHVGHVDTYLKMRVSLNPKTLNNHLTLLISRLNLAKALGWIKEVTKIQKPKALVAQNEFAFLKSDDEIQRFLGAAREYGEDVFVLYSMALYTGMRFGELAGLRWADIDFDQRLITVQRSYNTSTKSGRVRHVPILDCLLPLLRSWRMKCPFEQVVPNRWGKMLKPSSRISQETLRKVLKAADLPEREEDGKSRGYIVFHDLRHTFASHWMRQGGDLFKLQKILGHQEVKMTLRYAHLSPDAFREDYGRLKQHIPGSETAEIYNLFPESPSQKARKKGR